MAPSEMFDLADELNLTAEDLAPAVNEAHRSNANEINRLGLGRQLHFLWDQYYWRAWQFLHEAAAASRKELDPAPWCLATDDSQAAAAVRELWDAITTELAHSDGRWPPHAIAEHLAEWFSQHGFNDKAEGGEA